MCIRDSLGDAPAAAAERLGDGDADPSPGRHGPVEVPGELVVGVAATPVAVSYTHLRAHETVLDLVCRLLLEKKKHNTLHAII